MHAPDDPYLTFLRARAGRLFYRMPYPGNAGDALIQFATQAILDDLGIRTTVDPRRAEVILVPGGNPSMWPSIGVDRWRDVARRHPGAELVVGPAGFRTGHSDWDAFVNSAGSPVTSLFARDPDSHETLRKAVGAGRIVCGLSHDPALYLRDSAWLASHREAAMEEYDLAAFRDDHEGQAAGLPWHSIPFVPGRVRHFLVRRRVIAARRRRFATAAALGGETRLPLQKNDVSRSLLEVFMEVIRGARLVHTDRLHVMLAAAMLGKKVYAYRTSHAKLEGVYRHSLAGWAQVEIVGTR